MFTLFNLFEPSMYLHYLQIIIIIKICTSIRRVTERQKFRPHRCQQEKCPEGWKHEKIRLNDSQNALNKVHSKVLVANPGVSCFQSMHSVNFHPLETWKKY